MTPTFTQLGIPDDLNQGIEALGIIEPTPVQVQAIPFLMEDGGDLIAQAQTGTGKTAAFGLPLLAKIDPTFKEIQGVIIAPTRELAQQIAKQLFRYTKFSAKIFVLFNLVDAAIDIRVDLARLLQLRDHNCRQGDPEVGGRIDKEVSQSGRAKSWPVPTVPSSRKRKRSRVVSIDRSSRSKEGWCRCSP